MTTYHIDFKFESPLERQQWVSLPFKRNTLQWSNIEGAYRNGNSITIPQTRFSLDKQVKDEIAGWWQGGSFHAARTLIAEKTCPSPGCIVVVLESPHFHEYGFASNGEWKPLAPLNKPGSRTRFDEHIGRLVSKIRPNTRPRADIVLCNPVPLQASLAHLMKAEVQESVQGLVRNCVWVALYQGEYELDFLNRLECYEPQAVINACTSYPKKKVGMTLAEWTSGSGSKKVALWNCTEHPSVWNSSTDISRVN